MDCFKLNDKLHGSQSCRRSKLHIKCAIVQKLFDVLIFICNVLNVVFLFSCFQSSIFILFLFRCNVLL
jgi:hypothetical protein